MSKIYLGDSVYAEIEKDIIKLTTNNGYPDDPRNIIYMEPEVFQALLLWIKAEIRKGSLSSLFNIV